MWVFCFLSKKYLYVQDKTIFFWRGGNKDSGEAVTFLLVSFLSLALSMNTFLSLFQRLQGDSGKTRTVVGTKKVCVTPECNAMSRRILGSIDPHRDPCDSFYAFACGGWMATNQPPPKRLAHSVMTLNRDKVDEKLRGEESAKEFTSTNDVCRTDH